MPRRLVREPIALPIFGQVSQARPQGAPDRRICPRPSPGLARPFRAEAVPIEMPVTITIVSKTNVTLFITTLLHKEVYATPGATHRTPPLGTAPARIAAAGVRSFNVHQRHVLRRKVRNRKKSQRAPGPLRAQGVVKCGGPQRCTSRIEVWACRSPRDGAAIMYSRSVWFMPLTVCDQPTLCKKCKNGRRRGRSVVHFIIGNPFLLPRPWSVH